MSLLAFFGITSGVLSAICYIPYIRDIFKGSTKPERATWFIWSVLTSILLFAQLAKGATNSIWLTVVQSLGVILIFALSIKFGEGGLQRRDILALIAAGIGLVAWYFTKEAAVALWLTIAIDFSGASLTIVKAYQEPETETQSTWVLSGIAGIFGAMAVGYLSLSLLAFPIYVIVVNFAVFFAIRLGFMRKSRRRVSA
jgi:hypothetical protein